MLKASPGGAITKSGPLSSAQKAEFKKLDGKAQKLYAVADPDSHFGKHDKWERASKGAALGLGGLEDVPIFIGIGRRDNPADGGRHRATGYRPSPVLDAPRVKLLLRFRHAPRWPGRITPG